MTSGPIQYFSLRSSKGLVELTQFLCQRFGWRAFERSPDGTTAVVRAQGLVLSITFSRFDANHTRHNIQFEIHEPPVGEGGTVSSLQIMEVLRPLHERLVYRHERHWWLYSRRSLERFTTGLASHLGLPAFEYDAENENEWAIAENEQLRVHVSRAYDRDTYHRWNPKTCPRGANYSVEIAVKPGAPAAWDEVWLREEGHARWQAALATLGTILEPAR